MTSRNSVYHDITTQALTNKLSSPHESPDVVVLVDDLRQAEVDEFDV